MRNFLLNGIFFCLTFILLGCLPEKEDLEITQATTTLTVKTTPAGAEIYVNEKGIGISPVSIPILANKPVTVSTQLSGFRRANKVCQALLAGNELNFVLRPITGSLAVKTEPVGAELTVNGMPQGVSPLVMSHLSPGKYNIIAKKPGFTPESKMLEVPVDGSPVWVSMILNSNTTSLEVAAQDEEEELLVGAKILLNDKEVGVTPYKNEFEEGAYKLEVQHNGYQSVVLNINLLRGTPETRKVTLIESPGGLKINSSPIGATVFVNDQQYGITPLSLDNLSPGAYKVAVQKTGFDREEKTLIVNRGQILGHSFMLNSNEGGIDIDVAPVGAKVFVNGKFVGHVKGLADDRFKPDVLKVRNLAAGAYKIEVSHRDATPNVRRQTIEVKSSQISRAKLSLWLPNVELQMKNGLKKRGFLVSEDINGIVFEEVRGAKRTLSRDSFIQITPLNTVDP